MQFRFTDYTIKVNIPDLAALLSEVRRRFQGGQGFALATINLDHLVKLRSSPGYRAAYAAHDLIVADGNPIVWLSSIAHQRVSLVPGSDALLPILELAAQEKVPVGFFGSMSDVLTEAEKRLEAEVQGLNVVWTASPAMGFDPTGPEAERALADMRANGVRLCIISLSAPRQEAFAAFGHSQVPEIGFCCFGAGLDFVAGRQIRAPEWVRVFAMEWLWRAMSAPRRMIPRYLACIAILPEQVLAAIRLSRG